MSSRHYRGHAVPRAGDADAAMRYVLGKEQAGALGRAGRTLEMALQGYRQLEREARPIPEAVRCRVAEALWALAVQREIAGFGPENLKWLRQEFDLPDEIINRMGVLPGPAGRSRCP